MLSEIRPVLFFAAMLLGTASGQVPYPTPAPQVGGHRVNAEVVDSKGLPLRYAFLELRSQKQGETGVRAAADADGKVVVPSMQQGTYLLSVGAGGFIDLSRTIEIDGDKDLGRIALDADPNVLHASTSVIGFSPAESDAAAAPVKVITTPRVIRGRIESSVVSGRRLMVQLSCSAKPPGMNERPQRDVALAPVDAAGSFEISVPRCSGVEFAHLELRFSLKDEHGGTVALLLPKLTPQGYYQSKIGIWFPLKPWMEQSSLHEAMFFPEFTDNRPLQARISISPFRDRFVDGETIFLNYKLTNTANEVLALSSASFESDFAWIISDDHGKRVPLRLFRDRTGEPLDGNQPVTRSIIFPGESETGMVNMSLLFNLTAPGTYHVLASRIVRRPELPGEEQVTSAESTFVIVARTHPN